MRSLTVTALLLAVLATADAACERNYNLLGCYQERNPQNMLFNNRHAINWKDIVGYMNDLACECAKQAKADGYAGFALHYYGECYGKTNAEIKEIQMNGRHQQHLCVGDQKYDMCNTSAHDHCTGGSWAEGVYAFKTAATPVDGGFSPWQPWTACDKNCGSGLKHRERNCDSPAPSGSGKDCSELGNYTESSPCKIKDCPVNGGWSSDGSYGVCSKKCGTGTKTKTRTCTNPVPQHGGAGCTGSSSISTNCNTEGCPDLISCSTKYTSWNSHDGGNMVSLDRHRPDCGAGKVMSYYHLEKSGANIRYRYKCCQFKGNVYTMQQKYTSFSDDGNGKMYYLDRHTADCRPYGFISSIRIERNSGHDKVRYNYKCATLNVSKWQSHIYCGSKYTAVNDDGNGKVFYLDRQTLSCGSGQGLGLLKLKRKSRLHKVFYYYRCCKVYYR